MALFDKFEANVPVTGVAMALVALVLPIALPALRPILLPVMKSGARLFLESEWAADGAIADKLVDATMGILSGVIAQPAATESERAERHRKAEAAVRRFERRARSHAQHWGRTEADRTARYRRRVARLRDALATRRNVAAEDDRAAWGHVSGLVVEDW